MTRAASRSTVLTIAAAALALSAVATTGYAAGRITGADITDKTLGPDDVMVRVASAQVDNGAATGVTGTQPLLRVTVQAPTKGYLVVTASSDVFNIGVLTGAECWVDLGGKYAFGSSRFISLDEAGNNEENCATNITIPVAGGRHVVRFMASIQSPDLMFGATSLQAEFVPFNGTGGRPTAAQIKAAVGSRQTKATDRR